MPAKHQLYPSILSFLRYCKDIANLFILGDLGMPGYGHQKGWYQPVKIFMPKIKLIPRVFHEILLIYCRLVFLGTLNIPGHTHQKTGNLDFACKKSTSLLPTSSRYCKDIATLLFWVL